MAVTRGKVKLLVDRVSSRHFLAAAGNRGQSKFLSTKLASIFSIVTLHECDKQTMMTYWWTLCHLSRAHPSSFQGVNNEKRLPYEIQFLNVRRR
eukprot:scaffold1516_cov192-Alexandrium_tamarense.AAC.37